MVTGADRDRLDLLLGLEYAVVGVVALVLTMLVTGRGHGPDREADLLTLAERSPLATSGRTAHRG